MERSGSAQSGKREGLRLFVGENGDRLTRTAGGLLVAGVLAAAVASPRSPEAMATTRSIPGPGATRPRRIRRPRIRDTLNALHRGY